MKINLVNPKNLKKEHFSLFNILNPYRAEISKVKKFKNVFVTHDGLVLNKFILYNRSGYNLTGYQDINFYFPYWKDTLEKFFVCKFGKSLHSETYCDSNFAIVHTKWFNYAFWMNDSIYRCILLEENFHKKDYTILIPKSIYEQPFVKETIGVFDFQIKIINPDEHCFVNSLFFPQVREYSSSFHPKVIDSIQKKLIPLALEKTTVKHFPSKIYLSRKNRGVRSLLNEDEVEDFLSSLGFTILSFEQISVWDQIVYMQNAKWLISNHGAGLTNCMFMKENTNVIEFLEYDLAHYGNPFPYWKLANSAKLNYYYLFGVSVETQFIRFVNNCFTTSKKRMSMVNRQIKIDIMELKKVLNG